MAEAVEKSKLNAPHAQTLIDQVKEIWDEWDTKEVKTRDNALQYDTFYHAFMEPYFGCFRCEDTRRGLDAIDMDDDG